MNVMRYISSYFRTVFSIDARSLAAVRIGTSLILLWHLFSLLPHIQKYYLSSGIIPGEREFITQVWYSVTSSWVPSWTLHRLFDNEYWLIFLFAIHIFVAVLLLVGYRTRIATVVAFVLYLSADHAHSVINNGGDSILRLLLFFGMFLPWGKTYSLDVARQGQVASQASYLSPWTVAVLIQIALIYVCSFFFKYGDLWWNGQAVHYVTASIHANELGRWFHNFPLVNSYVTYAILFLQATGPLLLFSPYKTTQVRIVVVTALMFFHFAFWTMLSIKWFGFIAIVALTLFVPGRAWNTISRFLVARKFGGLTFFYDGTCNFCRTSVYLIRGLGFLPQTQCIPAHVDRAAHHRMQRENSWVVRTPTGETYVKYEAGLVTLSASPLFFWLVPMLRMVPPSVGNGIYDFIGRHRPRVCPIAISPEAPRVSKRILRTISRSVAGICIIAIIIWNVGNIYIVRSKHETYRRPELFKQTIFALGLSQSWRIFSPQPTQYMKWIVVELEWSDGSRTNPLRDNEPVTFDPPPGINETFGDHSMHKYFERALLPQNHHYQGQFVKYFCSLKKDHEGIFPLTVAVHELRKPIDRDQSVQQHIFLERECLNF